MYLDVWKQQDAATKMCEVNLQVLNTEEKQDVTVWHLTDKNNTELVLKGYLNTDITRNIHVYSKQGQIYVAPCLCSKYKKITVTSEKLKMCVNVAMHHPEERLYMYINQVAILCKDGRMRNYDVSCRYWPKYKYIAELFANYVIQVG